MKTNLIRKFSFQLMFHQSASTKRTMAFLYIITNKNILFFIKNNRKTTGI